jgi:hypothetical protein
VDAGAEDAASLAPGEAFVVAAWGEAAGDGAASAAGMSAGFLAQAAKAMRVRSGTNLRTSTSVEVRSRNREHHGSVVWLGRGEFWTGFAAFRPCSKNAVP